MQEHIQMAQRNEVARKLLASRFLPFLSVRNGHCLFGFVALFVCFVIAFITCNSNLLPLLEGLCSSNPCSVF